MRWLLLFLLIPSVAHAAVPWGESAKTSFVALDLAPSDVVPVPMPPAFEPAGHGLATDAFRVIDDERWFFFDDGGLAATVERLGDRWQVTLRPQLNTVLGAKAWEPVGDQVDLAWSLALDDNDFRWRRRQRAWIPAIAAGGVAFGVGLASVVGGNVLSKNQQLPFGAEIGTTSMVSLGGMGMGIGAGLSIVSSSIVAFAVDALERSTSPGPDGLRPR